MRQPRPICNRPINNQNSSQRQTPAPAAIQQGLSLREACVLVRDLCVAVKHLPGTGEYLFSFGSERVRHHGRRENASRALVRVLRLAAKEASAALAA